MGEIRLTKEERDEPPTDEELKQFHSREEVNEHRVLKKAEPLIRQDEREKIKILTLQSIADEPEFPGNMPDKLWEKLNDNRNNVKKALSNTVRLTKNGITERFLQALKAPVNKPPFSLGCGELR